MRVTIAHSKPKQDVKDIVERSLEQMFSGLAVGRLEFTDRNKQWSGDTMAFSFTARLGFLKTPIQGSAVVSDQDVTLDVDLGLLNRLVPEDAAKNRIEGKVRRLLTE